MTAIHFIFKGNVQGVGFRYNVCYCARGFDITGYVKNLPDGSVEMLAQGEKSEINALLAAIKEKMAGHIREVLKNPRPINHNLANFNIAY